MSPSSRLFITGHGSGGALASLVTLGVILNLKEFPPVTYLFGSPRAGNPNFVEVLNGSVDTFWAVVNEPDFVTDLPPQAVPSISRTWYYPDFRRRAIVSLQQGNLVDNHALEDYICGLSAKAKECPLDIIWRFEPMLTMNINN